MPLEVNHHSIDEKFYQVRVKSLEFLQKNAIAIYFYDFTATIQALKLNKMLLEKEKQNASLNLSQMTLSHEFRAPLSSTLMLLESLLLKCEDETHRQIIRMVISQINLLICLVNDLLDLKMLDQGKF